MSRIAIVDDRVTNRNIFAKLAGSIEPDVEVCAFADPDVALTWLTTNTPDLVITDYKMPSMDGAEFIRRFRAIPKRGDIPVIVITVYEERSFRLRALEAGATDFLHSPVDHHEFVTRARNLLKLHKHQLLLAIRAEDLAHELHVSEQSRQRELRDSRERLAQVIDTLPVMISAASSEGRILFVNSYQSEAAGIDPTHIIEAPIAALFGFERGARSQALDKMVFETGAALPAYEEEFIDRGNVRRDLLTTKSPLKEASGIITGVLTSSLDITIRKDMEAHMRHLAQHDALTGLPNRVLLVELMNRMIARARRGSRAFALHILDLDGFKSVNDLFGHSAGDRFLNQISMRLKSVIREGDTLARLGGDEFAILQSEVTDPSDAEDMARRILASIGEPLQFDGTALRASGSVGIALHPTDGADPEELMKMADLAMYRAKGNQGNAFCFYAADMQARARQIAALDDELRRAIDEKEFVLLYQPQVDLATNQIVGAEALLRWQRPGFGLTSPASFLARAEENGLIIPISEWVLHEACSEARCWISPHSEPIRVSVNLSPVQFRKQTVPLIIARTLADCGLDPRRLDVELTETIVLDDLERAAGDLQQLLDLGVRVSIDDFGTGYSSLSYVKRLPADRLKIDQSFVRNVATDPNDAAIVRAIVMLGHSLDLTVLAEGVETADQLAYLRAEGCDEVQGFFFGRPMSAERFRSLIGMESTVAKSA